ncbi:MAG: FGGY family carbohydrate kinase [Anaerolineales bacterium]|jgi:sugar (pentulose or hexulose) kinase|nr:FGGY family carbohydrate kinase [Anaerolineales bacterium]
MMFGLDLGTTNCKAVLLDGDGQARSVASEGYKLQIPHPRAAELDVRHVWEAAKKVLRAVANSASVLLSGIWFSGAIQSLFQVSDETGTPISNAMTWADARATAGYRGLVADTDTHALCRRTRRPGHSTYHLQRLRWWERFEPEQVQQAYLWVGINEWVREKLFSDLVGTAGYDQLARDAASVPPGAEGVFLLPYFAGERSPHWAPKDKGMLYGLSSVATAEPGPIYTPNPRNHQFYKQHHREYRALRRGMAAMGETLENLKESYE